MAVLPIYVAPHPVLKKIAEPVKEVTDATRKLMDDMLHTMYAAPGIGLAAPQVGKSLRILIIDIDQPKITDEEADADPMRRKGQPQYFVNPEITWESEELNVYDEGCLSLPGQFAEVERPLRIKLKYLGYDGKPHEIEADGLLATCLQHEMDHLNGILFVDHLSTLKRDIVMRKLRKWTKEFQEEEGFAETYVL